jgi:hypothetical protein
MALSGFIFCVVVFLFWSTVTRPMYVEFSTLSILVCVAGGLYVPGPYLLICCYLGYAFTCHPRKLAVSAPWFAYS